MSINVLLAKCFERGVSDHDAKALGPHLCATMPYVGDLLFTGVLFTFGPSCILDRTGDGFAECTQFGHLTARLHAKIRSGCYTSRRN
eukprot:6101654-Pleurochrysis_carterae.AAC.1